MSGSIKLNSASGGGSVSLQAPSSSSNNRVLTLPDVADTTLSTVNGIKMLDVWTLSTTYNFTSGDIVDLGFVRANSYAATIGSAMTESSGVFTFPETGIYEIVWDSSYASSSDLRYVSHKIEKVVSGTVSNMATKYGRINTTSVSGTHYGNTQTRAFFNVSNVSTHKVRFEFTAVAGVSLSSAHSSNFILTGFYFIRIGDT